MSRTRMRTRALAAVALLGVLAGLLSLPPLVAGQGQRIEVQLTEFSITPNSITVTAGEPVTFVVSNTGGAQHNLTFAFEAQGLQQTLFPTNLQPGETREATITFDTSGEWVMYCPVGRHRELGMVGTLVVQAATTPTPAMTPTPAATPTMAPAPSLTPTPIPRATPTPAPQVAPATGRGGGSASNMLLVSGLVVLGLAGLAAGLAARQRMT